MFKKIFRFIHNPFYKSEEALSGSDRNSFFWKNVKKQFSKNKLGVYSLRFLCFFVIIALLADILANEKPLIAKYKDGLYFPVFRSYAVDIGIAQWQKDILNADWKNLKYDWVVFPPVPYLPQGMDGDNIHSVSPFGEQKLSSWRWRHWFGTDEYGRDILSGMIHGTRTALTVGLVSMGIASLFGILIGALAGYFGDARLKISRASVILNILFFFLGIFWGFIARSYELTDALSLSFGNFFLQVLFSILILIVTLFAGNALAIPFKCIP